MRDLYYVYYSAKQEKVRLDIPSDRPPSRCFYELEDGAVVQVTEASSTEKQQPYAFKDMVYLGRGRWSHNKPYAASTKAEEGEQ